MFQNAPKCGQRGSGIEQEYNHDLGVLFEKEDEIRRLKNDVKRFRQSLNTLLRSQENYSHVQREFETCDHHEGDVGVQVTQPVNEGNSLEEKFPVNTTDLDTRESQNIPVSATYGTEAPAESKLTHPVPPGQLQQPVPHISQEPTPQVNLRIFPIVSILFAALVCSHVMGNPNSTAASHTKITVINLQEELRKY